MPISFQVLLTTGTNWSLTEKTKIYLKENKLIFFSISVEEIVWKEAIDLSNLLDARSLLHGGQLENFFPGKLVTHFKIKSLNCKKHHWHGKSDNADNKLIQNNIFLTHVALSWIGKKLFSSFHLLNFSCINYVMK